MQRDLIERPARDLAIGFGALARRRLREKAVVGTLLAGATRPARREQDALVTPEGSMRDR